ncbi:hypothetical protein KAU32_01670 [bacterium]|nr:hypothetical protein [bacterium]
MKSFKLEAVKFLKLGPISNFDKKLKPFTIIRGSNESGKTYLLEGILYKLGLLKYDKRGAPPFDIAPARYDTIEQIEGTITLYDDKGRPVSDFIKVLTYLDLSEEDFRKLFIVRSSDLDTGSYLGPLSEKLLGSEQSLLQKIEKNLRGEFLSPTRVKTDLKSIFNDIDEINKTFSEDDEISSGREAERKYLELMKASATLEDKLVHLGNEHIRLEQAASFKKREQVSAFQTDLQSKEEQLNELKAVEENAEEFRKLDATCSRLKAEHITHGLEKTELEQAQTAFSQKLAESAQRHKYGNERLQKLENICGRISSGISKGERASLTSSHRKAFMLISVSSMVLSLLFLIIGAIMKNPYLLYGGGSALIIILILLLINVKGGVKVSEEAEIRWKDEIRGLGLDITNISEIFGETEKLREEVSNLGAEVDILNGERNKIDGKIEGLTAFIDSISAKYSTAENGLTELRTALKIQDLDQLDDRLRNIADLKKEIQQLSRQIVILSATISDEKEPLTELAKEYRDISLDDLNAGIADIVSRIEGGAGERDILESDIRNIEESRKKMRDQVRNYALNAGKIADRLGAFNEKAGMNFEIEDIGFHTAAAVEQLINALLHEKARLETSIRIKEQTIGLLGNIGDDISSEFSRYFGADSRVSKVFSKLTSDKYTQVDYDRDENTLYAKDTEGHIYSVDELSQGTFDQLYFSVKIAFGEEIFDGIKGFFLLDDPFIAADKKRFENGMKMLKKLSDDGWQIIYFTVQDRAGVADAEIIEM